MTNDELIEHFGLPKYRKIESPVPFVKPGELSFTQRQERERTMKINDALVARIGGYDKLYTPKQKPCPSR